VRDSLSRSRSMSIPRWRSASPLTTLRRSCRCYGGQGAQHACGKQEMHVTFWLENLTQRKRPFRHIQAYEGVSKSFRTGRLERKLQMVQLSATRYSCIAILWVSLASFTAITLCVASQRVFIVVSVQFVIETVRKLLDTHSCRDISEDIINTNFTE
jgi:hypothetical protein